MRLSSENISANDILSISLSVQNIGQLHGDEVVQLYFSDRVASMVRPAIEYAGAIRIHLKKGEKARISFNLRASQLAFLDSQMKWIVEKGEYSVMVGASANDIRLENTFFVSETEAIDPQKRGFYATAGVHSD